MFTPSAGSGQLGSSSYLLVNANQDSTTTALSIAPEPPGIGLPVSYTATVTPSYTGPDKPSGSVAFVDGSSLITSCSARPLSAAGTATCTTVYAAGGSHRIEAVYVGDANFLASASAAQTVAPLQTGSGETLVPGKPYVSSPSLAGIATRKPRLSFTVAARNLEPRVSKIAIALPRGLSFASKFRVLARGIVVKGPGGKRLRSTAKLSHGVLAITFQTATLPPLEITISKRAISVSRSLAAKAQHRRLRTLTILVETTDSAGSQTRVAVRIRTGSPP